MYEDECGQCLGTDDENWNSCIDCDGVVNGNKAENPCGFCIVSSLANFATYGMDCRGDCRAESEEEYSWDECGQCLKTEDDKRDKCVGCDDIPNSGNFITYIKVYVIYSLTNV